MRRSIATISAAALGLALITPGAAHAAPTPSGPGDGLTAAQRASLAAGLGVAPKAPYGAKPKGPNPLLAEVADATKVDYAGWANYIKAQRGVRAKARAKAQAADPALKALAAVPPVVVDEDE